MEERKPIVNDYEARFHIGTKICVSLMALCMAAIVCIMTWSMKHERGGPSELVSYKPVKLGPSDDRKYVVLTLDGNKFQLRPVRAVELGRALQEWGEELSKAERTE